MKQLKDMLHTVKIQFIVDNISCYCLYKKHISMGEKKWLDFSFWSVLYNCIKKKFYVSLHVRSGVSFYLTCSV